MRLTFLSRAAVAAAASVLAVGAACAPAAASPRDTRVFHGGAFDTCEAPRPHALDAWRASPYGAVGVYVGGADRACANTRLTPGWVREVHAQGWEFLPIYVGAQAPCSSAPKRSHFDRASASDEGAREADDAVAAASALGFRPGSPVYFDMEAYATGDAACRAAVLDFVSAWSEGVRAHGYLAGYYSSLDSGIADVVAAARSRAVPDALWYAAWNGNAVTDGDGALPDGLWSGSRVHQYQGNTTESYGGVTMSIDRNAVDGPVAVL